MTDDMMRLHEFAGRIAPATVIGETEEGFTLTLPEAELSFFAAGGQSAAAYCRASVAELGEGEFPAAFAEEALKGNFFWRGTNGAVLSLNEKENTIYLTDRFDEGAFEDEGAFGEYIEGFLATLGDWRTRLSLYIPEVEETTDKEEKEVL